MLTGCLLPRGGVVDAGQLRVADAVLALAPLPPLHLHRLAGENLIPIFDGCRPGFDRDPSGVSSPPCFSPH